MITEGMSSLDSGRRQVVAEYGSRRLMPPGTGSDRGGKQRIGCVARHVFYLDSANKCVVIKA